jgi:PAS domain S-box-containing protein
MGGLSNFDPDAFARTLAAEAPDAVVYADAKGVIRFWNRAATRLFGYQEAEAVGQPLDIIIPEKLRARHWAGYDEAMKTGRSRYGEGELLAVPGQRKDGSRLSLEFTVLPFRGRDGAITGIAAILRDVTSRFNALRSLRRQLAERQRGA